MSVTVDTVANMSTGRPLATGASLAPASHLAVGDAGERAAELAYVRRGYRVRARNWRCRLGELDLVLARGGVVVFCEVKTRRGRSYGEPWQAVAARKQSKLRAVAQAFLIASGERPASVRFDVASVRLASGPGGDAVVHVYEDAF
jgi:putative endonuclease